MNLFKTLTCRQLGQNYIDRAPRGQGNSAARRAIHTARGVEHLYFTDEPTYTDRPQILRRGEMLLLVDKYPSLRGAI